MMYDLDVEIFNQIGDAERERMVVVESANDCGENSFRGCGRLTTKCAGRKKDLLCRKRVVKKSRDQEARDIRVRRREEKDVRVGATIAKSSVVL